MTVSGITLTETVDAGDYGAGFSGLLAATADGFKMRSGASLVYRANVAVTETARIHPILSAAAQYQIALRIETIHLRNSLIRSIATTLVQTMGLSLDLALSQATALFETIALQAALATQLKIMQALSTGVSISAGAIPALGSLLRESLHTQDGTSWVVSTLRLIEEMVTASDAVDRSLRVLVVEREDVALDDALTLQMVLEMIVNDGISLGHGFADPAGGVTTWTMNARTGSLSEYRNWDFNSYAQFGERYIAASEDGLFELIGDRDQETPIIAIVGKELVALTGSHLTGLKQAYVAIRGEGTLFLKITGTKQSTVYRVMASKLKTTRVDLGKGWRSRYLSWELESTGQDFDLTGLNFLPVTFTRRSGGA